MLMHSVGMKEQDTSSQKSMVEFVCFSIVFYNSCFQSFQRVETHQDGVYNYYWHTFIEIPNCTIFMLELFLVCFFK